VKIITLNTWGGRIREPLIEFLGKHQDVDIFCFQEILHQAPIALLGRENPPSLNFFSDIEKALPNHRGYFRPAIDNFYGIAMFVNKNIKVLGEGDIWIHEGDNSDPTSGHHSRNLQWAKVSDDQDTFTVSHIHGLWNGKGKTDTPERLMQSKRIKDFVDKISGPKILCGDFNLMPETESVKILEEGLDNLVKKFRVTSTRTSYYTKPEKFADYIFVSPNVKVADFQVLPDEVSDHCPLYCDFSI
jgi:endonuclease/exonuclease/phosphatase family metal-dependent hydrolase